MKTQKESSTLSWPSTSEHDAPSTASHEPSRPYRHVLTALLALFLTSCSSHRQMTRSEAQATATETTRHAADAHLKLETASLQSDTMQIRLTPNMLATLPVMAEYNVSHDGTTASIKRETDTTLTLRCVAVRHNTNVTADVQYSDYDSRSLNAKAGTQEEHPPDNTPSRLVAILCAAESIALVALLIVIIIRKKT